MWDHPRPGIEPVSPALAGGFLSTAPPRKSPSYLFYFILFYFLLFFKINLFICFYFWLCWVFLAVHRLSLVWLAGATLDCGAWASRCRGFSCCRARALGVWDSVVVAHGLSSRGSRALEHRLSSSGARA